MKNNTPLCNLFIKYGADKALGHSYSPVYYSLLESHKNEYTNILEIGIGNIPLMSSYVKNYIPGASLRAWRDFFPNANVFGLDIDESVLFEEDRLKCFYTDQSKEEILLETIKNIGVFSFDLIIDDGSHIPNHMVKTFHTYFPYLSDNGIYIIEDIDKRDLDMFQSIDFSGKILHVHKGLPGDNFVAYIK